MDQIRVTLTVDEINRILSILADRPFKEVYDLIGKIRMQAQQQLGTPGTTEADQAVGGFGLDQSKNENS